MTSPAFFAQADPRWKDTPLGRGTRTHGQAGCLIVAIAEAVRRLTDRPAVIPPDVNQAAILAGAFSPGSSAAVVRTAVLAAGLRPGLRVEGIPPGDPRFAHAIREACKAGAALVEVTHSGGRRHWVCALSIRDVFAFCADPAGGRGIALDLATLQAQASWGGRPRIYSVRSVVPVSAEASSRLEDKA